MNFCPNCEFMVYTKREEGSLTLTNYCKNCSWEGEYLSEKEGEPLLVYKNNFNKEHISEKYIINKYTKNDPTLPRISNISCINKECLTNLDIEENTLIVKNITESNLEGLKTFITEKIIEEKNITIKRVNDTEVLITFLVPLDLEKLESHLDKEILINDEIVSFNIYNKPNREIIFIKYDTENMRYLYLCTTCSSSWKNQ